MRPMGPETARTFTYVGRCRRRGRLRLPGVRMSTARSEDKKEEALEQIGKAIMLFEQKGNIVSAEDALTLRDNVAGRVTALSSRTCLCLGCGLAPELVEQVPDRAKAVAHLSQLLGEGRHVLARVILEERCHFPCVLERAGQMGQSLFERNVRHTYSLQSVC